MDSTEYGLVCSCLRHAGRGSRDSRDFISRGSDTMAEGKSMSLVPPINSSEYITRQMQLAELHREAQVGLLTLSTEWCWRRDLACMAVCRAFEESRRIDKK